MVILRPLVFALAVFGFLSSGTAYAGVPDDLALEFSSPIVSPGEVGEIFVTGTGQCPVGSLREVTGTTIVIDFSDSCILLPPDPDRFSIPITVGPLDIGVYSVDVRESFNNDLLLSEIWQVGYPLGRVEVEISPDPIQPGEPAQAIITGEAACPYLYDTFFDGSRIDIVIEIDCVILPPDPAPFRFVVDLPILAAGDYTLAVRDFGFNVYLDLQDLTVGESLLQLDLLPDIATNLQNIAVAISGFAACVDLRSIDLGRPEIEIEIGIGCPFTPPPPSAPFTLPLRLGRLDAGDYTVKVIEPFSGEVISRDLLVVESAPALAFAPEAPTDTDTISALVGLPGVEICDLSPEVTVNQEMIEVQIVDTCLLQPPVPAGYPQQRAAYPVELGVLEAGSYTLRVVDSQSNQLVAGVLDVRTTGACTPSATVLCLQGGRFEVQVDYTSSEGSGAAQAYQETPDSGSFTFFDEENVEVMVKVLDGCNTFFANFWVFAAGLTNVGVEVTVTDTETSTVRRYDNPQGRTFQTVLDTEAFPTCR